MACDWPATLASGACWVLVANLPYNVATPLVLDLLRDVPAIGRMVVMVQREAGERLVAAPGEKGFGAVSVRVAYFATAALIGRVPAAVFLPRPSVESVLVEIERRAAPLVHPGVASYEEIDLLLRAGYGGRRKMLRRSLAGLVDDSMFEAAGSRRAVEGGGARRGEVGQAGRMPPVDHVLAPAKLTRSLRIVGIRGDGYHLLETEMTSLDLADELEIEEGAEGLEVVDEVAWISGRPGASAARAGEADGRPAPGAAPEGQENLVVRALAAAGRRARVRLRKRIPGGAGLGGGSSDAAAVLRWAGALDPATAVGLGADVPFCVLGGRARVTRDRRRGRAPRPRGLHRRAGDAWAQRVDSRGLPGMGRPRRSPRGVRERPRGSRPGRRAAPFLVARSHLDGGGPAAMPGRERRHLVPRACSGGGAGARGRDLRGRAVRARDGPRAGRGQRAAAVTAPGPRRYDDQRRNGDCEGLAGCRGGLLLAGGASLPASALQHLLVLLLAHPLAALLDQ